MKKSNIKKAMEQETILGIAPILPDEKKYGFIDFFLIISGYAIATWCYTQGAYSASMVNFKQLLLSTVGISILVSAIVSLPVILSQRYGIDAWIWLRSNFGNNGCKILTILVVLMQFPWYAVAASMFGSSMANLLGFAGIIVPASANKFLGCISILIGAGIAFGGPTAIKWTTRIIVPAMLGVGVLVLIIATTAVPISDIAAYKPDLSAYATPKDGYMYAVEGVMSFAFSWTCAMFVLPRMCKTEKAAYWGTFCSYGLVCPFFIIIGGVLAMAMFVKNGIMESDPTIILANLASPKVAILSLVLVALANIGTQGVGTYMNGLVLKSSMIKTKYSKIVIFLTLYVLLLTIWDQVVDNFGAFLALETYLYAPIMSILFIDVFLVKKQKISMKDVYFVKGEKHSIYHFTKGFNFIGLGCVIFGIFCACMVYNPVTAEINSPLFYLMTGSGTSFLSAGIAYFIIAHTTWGRNYIFSRTSKNDITANAAHAAK